MAFINLFNWLQAATIPATPDDSAIGDMAGMPERAGR
jgi:hypothetical protein